MTSENRERDVRQWMEDIANNRRPSTKLIFNRKTKRLEPVSTTDPRADESLEFTPQEARRFHS